ncbi:MAG TPA: pyridoxal-phosphate dependent enzyme [Desulfobacterales bacterium]|nr:pyridoxal-phosphate dependent enzyme [Desulfobacterales bacterium]
MLPSGSQAAKGIRKSWAQGSRRSFDLFRPLLSGCNLLGHDRYGRILDGMTERLRRMEGRDFSVMPLTEAPGLASATGRTGRLWVKNETGNITGSHKGRHLMGTLLYLEALRELAGAGAKKVLAIYSCGNAAVGAAAVARAGGYELHAFVPEDVDPMVAAMLAERGTVVEKITRSATGEGDPCYLAFQDALNQNGWLPFACAGNDNWSNIEGGATLGWEMVMQLLERSEKIDSVVVQVGGGALARSVAQAFEEALQLGFIQVLPRIHVCQPAGGFPFVRAYLLALAEIARRSGLPFDLDYQHGADPRVQLEKTMAFTLVGRDQIQAVANFVKSHFDSPAMQSFLVDMAGEAGHLMWPWDGGTPHSLAHGILDDVTYDWYYLLRAVLRSGGRTEILAEETIRAAYEMAQHHTGIPVCPTGASGLAGLMQLTDSGAIDRGESAGLFFTGFDRSKAE